jgi:outer membrane lipoprotein-sorting protein
VTPLAVLLALTQISAGAIVARVKENDARIRDLKSMASLEITSSRETRTRRFEFSLRREESTDYRARVRIVEPESMAGTEILVQAERGKRNRQWAYFPDLDLVREIAGKSQDDPFLGSDLTYADLAGAAHLDDLQHRLLGEEMVGSDSCYVMEGIPKHRVAYGKLVGFIRKADFVVLKALFYDREGRPLKEAILSDVLVLGDGIRLAHRIEIQSSVEDRKTVLTFSQVVVNAGVPAESFTERALGKR